MKEFDGERKRSDGNQHTHEQMEDPLYESKKDHGQEQMALQPGHKIYGLEDDGGAGSAVDDDDGSSTGPASDEGTARAPAPPPAGIDDPGVGAATPPVAPSRSSTTALRPRPSPRPKPRAAGLELQGSSLGSETDVGMNDSAGPAAQSARDASPQAMATPPPSRPPPTPPATRTAAAVVAAVAPPVTKQASKPVLFAMPPPPPPSGMPAGKIAPPPQQPHADRAAAHSEPVQRANTHTGGATASARAGAPRHHDVDLSASFSGRTSTGRLPPPPPPPPTDAHAEVSAAPALRRAEASESSLMDMEGNMAGLCEGKAGLVDGAIDCSSRSELLCEGYLDKLKGNSMKNRTRHFRLTQTRFSYYESHGGSCINSYAKQDICSIEDVGTTRFALKILHANEGKGGKSDGAKDLLLSAATEAAKKKWLAALRGSIKDRPGGCEILVVEGWLTHTSAKASRWVRVTDRTVTVQKAETGEIVISLLLNDVAFVDVTKDAKEFKLVLEKGTLQQHDALTFRAKHATERNKWGALLQRLFPAAKMSSHLQICCFMER